ncbi:hypothetical protein Tco_1245214 [Tanacetum coccineum]
MYISKSLSLIAQNKTPPGVRTRLKWCYYPDTIPQGRINSVQYIERNRSSSPTTLGDVFLLARIIEAHFENTNNQVVDNNGGDKKDPNVNDKQEVKKADDQEIENIKDEERKNVKDQQVSEQTINETADTITSLQSIPEENLSKEDVGNCSGFGKLHGVPVTVFKRDGFDDITSKLEWKPPSLRVVRFLAMFQENDQRI